MSVREAFLTGPGEDCSFPPAWVRFAEPDEVLSDFFDFFGVGVFSPVTAGASFDAASAAAFFDFLAFEVFSVVVSGLVCSGAADCSTGKP
jgi:hypothetical protein